MPNYSDKFDAVTTALNAMKAQIEALGTGQASIVEAINNTTAAINALIAAVNSGNTSAAAALAQIIQKLEELKNKIGGGGSTPAAEYVDLGLPSGLKWAKCNLGATKPEEFGNYYAWGETEPKADYSWATYKFGLKDALSKYNATDNKTTLDAEDDAATVKLGDPWRMPTDEECKELLNNCICTKTKLNGIDGYEAKSKINGNSIFFPAANHYEGTILKTYASFFLSKTLGSEYHEILGILLDLDEKLEPGKGVRHLGLSIRPVRP